MRKIHIIHTGGTISMEEDQRGAVKPGDKHPLNDLSGLFDIEIDVQISEIFRLPSPHVTLAHMRQLAKGIEEAIQNGGAEGVVVTHGTDTLEETAYFLDLVLQQNVPIVLTGAMRSNNELGADGPHNLFSAVEVALCKEAGDKGVLVVMNDEIHTAANVTKTHTSNVATFQSPQYGPIGIVTKRGVNFHHAPTSHDHFPIKETTKNVILLKAYAGMDEQIFQALSSLKIDGLVIEALGQGNMPPQTVPQLQKYIDKGIPIVLVSRCFNGIAQDVYGYEGGGRMLKELGIIFSNGLNGQKARIKLALALETTSNHEVLSQYFT